MFVRVVVPDKVIDYLGEPGKMALSKHNARSEP